MTMSSETWCLYQQVVFEAQITLRIQKNYLLLTYQDRSVRQKFVRCNHTINQLIPFYCKRILYVQLILKAHIIVAMLLYF